MVAPFFSNKMFPMHVRVAFTLMASLVMAPSLPLERIPATVNLGGATTFIIGELLVGLVIGFVAMCVFAGLQFAGQMISFQMGFSLINMIDPQSNVQVPVFSAFYSYLGLLLFLLIDGHHWFLQAINESFNYIGVGGMPIHALPIKSIVSMSAQILVIGVRIAGPIIAVTVITDILVGIIGRTAPQINILIVGMPLKLLIGFSCMSVSLYFIPRYLGNIFSSLSRMLFSLAH